MTNQTTIQKIIDGMDVTPRVGMQVVPDSWNGTGGPLAECDWDAADFRIPTMTLAGGAYLPTPSGFIELAANIEVTGRSIRYTSLTGRPFVRVRVTFVGDCEEDVVVGGRLFLDGKS